MTNTELARWIGTELGFELGDGPAAYFTKEQLLKIRDFIRDAKDAGIDTTVVTEASDEDPDEPSPGATDVKD